MNKRKKGGLEMAVACEPFLGSQSIPQAAMVLKDAKILSEISGIDLVANEVKYHHTSYQMSANRIRSRKSSKNSSFSTVNPPTLDDTKVYIEKSVIRNKRPELLTSVYARYLDSCDVSSRILFMRNLKGKFYAKLKFKVQWEGNRD